MAFANKHPAETALWALTPDGAKLAQKIASLLPGSVLFFSERLTDVNANAVRFARLKDAVAENFWDYSAHIFIMSTGITVRMIAPLIEHKTHDPAVLAANVTAAIARIPFISWESASAAANI